MGGGQLQATVHGLIAAVEGLKNTMRDGGAGAQPRRNTTDQTVSTARPRNHAGGLAYNWRKGTAKTKEKGPRKTRLQMILAEHKLHEASITARYQGLSAYTFASGTTPATSTYALNKKWLDGAAGTEGANNTMLLPVYAFNLSSFPLFLQTSTTDGRTAPFYRLSKLQKGTAVEDATLQNYGWIPQMGQTKEANATDIYWQVEQIKAAPSVLANANTITPNYYNWKWAEIELAFNSIAPVPRKVHIALCKFRNPVHGPVRSYRDGAATRSYDANTLDTKVVSESDLWWDQWLARKTTHPMRSVQPMHKTNPIHFLNYECICLENPEGVFTQRIMHTANKMMMCSNANLAEKIHDPAVNTGVSGSYIPPVWNLDNTALHQGAFPDRHKDTWLMIWADDFEQPRPVTDASYITPLSFDLKIRGKYTVQRF